MHDFGSKYHMYKHVEKIYPHMTDVELIGYRAIYNNDPMDETYLRKHNIIPKLSLNTFIFRNYLVDETTELEPGVGLSFDSIYYPGVYNCIAENLRTGRL